MTAATNLFDLNPAAMRDWFAALGEKPYRATQVLKWLYHHGVTDLDRMTDLARDLRVRLRDHVCFTLPEIHSSEVSADGTRKWLLRVDAQNCVETVFIPEPDRGTLCVSSQVGCPLACSFCATGKQGFSRNLGVAEIIGQLWLANRELGYFDQRQRIISNVVLMGMGEPLLNFDNVAEAVDLMLDDLGFSLARKRVTLSTAGVVPGIYKLAERHRICLAVSLHAPTDALRDVLVPINRSYPLRELMEACRHYARADSDEPITFEYVMLDGVNDSPEQARQLVRLLSGIPAKVNLIPFNPFPGVGYVRSPKVTIDAFRDILIKAGLMTITRKTRGDDIHAACGQLTGMVKARKATIQHSRTAQTR